MTRGHDGSLLLSCKTLSFSVPRRFIPAPQWVLSLPHALRFLLAYDNELCTEVLAIFTNAIFDWLKRTARTHADIPKGAELHTGSVTAIHRADSACKLNLHPHTLAFDGVYVHGPASDASKPTLRFIATPAPSKGDISAVAWEVCQRTMALLKDRGLGLDASPEDLDPDYGQDSLLGDPMVSQCAAASMHGMVLFGPRAGRQVWRIGSGPTDTDSHGRAAHGFDLHASRRVSARDRKGLERLCRYVLRPPLSHDRLTLTEKGKVRLRLKRPWQDGTNSLEFSPLDFIARLVPLVPPPKTHRIRYHGVLASHHRLRASVVPKPPENTKPEQLRLFGPRIRTTGRGAKHRIEWAELMARTLGADPLICPKCGDKMRIVAFVTRPASIAAHLRWRGMTPEASPANRPRGPPQLELPFPNTATDAR